MRRLPNIAVFTLFVATAAVWSASAMGYRGNTTPSIPIGLYRVTAERVGAGRYVIACPPPLPLFLDARTRGYVPHGPCPGGMSMLMKKVLGVPGDHVTVQADGVWINGQRVASSAPRVVDGLGRALAVYRSWDRVLGRGEYWLMSDSHPDSFDARYFGPVAQTQIQAVIAPVIVWHEQ
jgi:conjugative transfer signal peptidase TraF